MRTHNTLTTPYAKLSNVEIGLYIVTRVVYLNYKKYE